MGEDGLGDRECHLIAKITSLERVWGVAMMKTPKAVSAAAAAAGCEELGVMGNRVSVGKRAR